MRAGRVFYEAEDATPKGNVSVSMDALASGGKINKVQVDGQSQGEFTCAGTTFEACAVRGVLMSAGAHTVTVHPASTLLKAGKRPFYESPLPDCPALPSLAIQKLDIARECMVK